MSAEIRRANTEDVEIVAALFDEYRQFYHQQSDLDLARNFIGARLANGDAVIFVAVDFQGNGVGFCQLYPCFSSVSASPVLILNDLYVTQHARCVGVGRHLMTKTVDYATTNAVKSITLQTQKENARAKCLYESLGFQLDKEFLSYSLDIQ